MSKILFLALHRLDRNPSQRFRFEQYLDYLNKNGFECHFSYLISEKDDKVFYAKGHYFSKVIIVFKSLLKRLKEILSANKYDIIFVQRECFMLGTSFFEKRFSRSKAKFVMDFDDSIWLQNVSEGNKSLAWLKNAEKTAEIISYADLVLAGNPYLKEYALKYAKNVVVFPTTIDTEEYKRKIKDASNDKITIGWSGSVTTVQHFEFAIPILIKLKEKYGNIIDFKVIGDANYENKELDIKGLGWNKHTEIDDLSSIDIGIMPLPNDEWSKGKCGLKGLQYMALEIPTIMSAVGVNSEIIQDEENGFLASSEEEWVEKLSLLIESEELRQKIGKAGRKTVVESYSVLANQEKYLSLFKQLISQ